ncbi:MAG: F0F1 ATP synthase subunit epsilon [Deltaproteobacteria bacterium]|nr:F0F1 ATP synthase subunit epsilon [Deltaproteobacteria bacterium]
MGKLNLEVVTPAGIIADVEADIVVAPGSEGEFGVLPGHINFLSGIVPGELRYTNGDKTEYMAISSGFAEVSNDKVSVLVDSGEISHEIDIERAQSAMERAKERLAQKRDSADIDFIRAEAALQRAISRIKVAKKIG